MKTKAFYRLAVRNWLLAPIVLSVLSCVIDNNARADTAVLVGINSYQNAPEHNLRGCVNDMTQMAAALKVNGFDNIIQLSNREATKHKILQTLSGIRPTKRFVFYFSGHGSIYANVVPTFLPTDFVSGVKSSYISDSELHNAVSAISATSKTIILDSCHSGAMIREEGVASVYQQARFIDLSAYDPHSSTSDTRSINAPVGSDTLHLTGSDDNICYYTACRENEFSIEKSIAGIPQGVFTHFLTAHLRSVSAVRGEIWGTLDTSVSSQVSQQLNDHQHPLLKPTFSHRLVFDNSVGASSSTTPVLAADRTLWGAYNFTNPNPSTLNITMEPNRNSVTVNVTDIRLFVTSAQQGYLIFLERGTNGHIVLHYPYLNFTAESSLVQAGQMVSVPRQGKHFKANASGTERIKAILFSKKGDAQAILDGFNHQREVDLEDARNLEIALDQGHVDKFQTADVMFSAE